MAVIGLSAGRSRRQNAGNKMHAMIEEERAKMQNGQVQESDDDEDFKRNIDEEDVVDSDFAETDSEDEKQEEDQAQAAEAMLERAERRKQRKASKKRMIVPRFASTTAAHRAKSKEAKKGQREENDAEKSVGVRKGKVGESAAPLPVRVSSRTSAVRKAQETEALEQEREFMAEIKRSRKRHRRGGEDGSAKHSALTQEQLLEEAKQTEIENLEKLQIYQEREAEDKQRQRRMASRNAPLIIHPVAHYRSFSEKANGNAQEQAEEPRVLRTEYALDKLDDASYPLNPWRHKISVYPLKICPVTGLPARYFHPRARVPYANARAYRVLEEMVLGEHAFFYDIGAWSSTAIADN